MLKGTIFITDKIDYLYNIPLGKNNKIINLDEDGILQIESNDIIGGTCLLPPIEAKIAEADGNEQLYDNIYSSHLLLPFQQQFISALIAFLFKGGNLILFLPEIGYTNTTEKLIEHLFSLYGLHPGIIGSQDPRISSCYYDDKCIPIWLNMIYSVNAISAYEYLYLYPIDAILNNNMILNQLINDIKPYGVNTINDKINYIYRFHKKIHENKYVFPPIESID